MKMTGFEIVDQAVLFMLAHGPIYILCGWLLAERKIMREAVKRGYASYDENGDFKWNKNK